MPIAQEITRDEEVSADRRAALAGSLRFSVTRLARRLRQQDGNGLGPTITSALASIKRNGQLTHGELATLEQLAPPTITAIVAKMEAGGLITRETDERDRRVTRIEITPAGVEQLDDVRHRRTEWLEAQLLALTVDELDRLDAAADVLAKLSELPELSERSQPAEVSGTFDLSGDTDRTART